MVIVGGGLAGLAAAVGLAQHGVRSLVLESRPRLGGRASSFHDVATDQWIDNCQHVTMGCCTNFRKFCETIGIDGLFRRESTLYFVAPDGHVNRFAATSLPAPLHLASAFARLSYLTWGEKVALARGLRALARERNPSTTESFAEWLKRHQQPPRVQQRFWHVVLVSALSESLDRIGVREARKVFVDGFLAHRDAWQVDIPQAPLGMLYGQQLTDWCDRQGVEIRLGTAATLCQVTDGNVESITLRNGGQLTADDYIVAVPQHRLLSLLPEPCQSLPYFSQVEQLETAPISSVHLWFDRPIMSLPHAVCVEGLVQWVFDRTPFVMSHESATAGHYYQVVISASHELKGQAAEENLEQVLTCLRQLFPETNTANLLNSRQVTEHRAVFSPLPGAADFRPPQQSPLANLQLAGDYTQTGWPATMEGAVRSGFLAAENVLRRRGSEAKLLQPDLPVARLSRWLFGL